MMKRFGLLVIVILLWGWYLLSWFACRTLADVFHLSLFDLSLRLTEAIHNDQGVPIFLVRLFHNKLIGIVVDLFDHYIRFLDPVFLVSFLSFLGTFGLCVGIFHLVTEKKDRISKRFALAIFFLLPFVEVIHPLRLPFYILFLPYYLMALYGFYQYIIPTLTKKKIFILLLLGFLSLWWLLVFPQTGAMFCLR